MNNAIIFVVSFLFMINNSPEKLLFKSSDNVELLEIINDSLFRYEYKIGFNYFWSDGVIKKEGNYFILNSNLYDFSNLDIRVIEKRSSNDNLIFEIKDSLNLDELCNYFITFDDTLVVQSSHKKIILNNDIQFNDFRLSLACDSTTPEIPYLKRHHFASKKYVRKNVANNYFDIKWDTKNQFFFYQPMKDDTIMIKRNRLDWIKHNTVLYKVN